MSKDVKSGRLGQSNGRGKVIGWIVGLLVLAGGSYAAYHYNTNKPIEVPVASVRRGEFVVSVKSRGEIKSVRSTILSAPQVPNPRIVTLAESGKPVRRGEVVVEFDSAQLEQYYLDRQTQVRTVDSEIVQQRATHRITNEQDAMSLMTSQYDVQRSELEASKAEILSEIEGAKTRIDVGISQGALQQVKTTIKAHGVSQDADIDRLQMRKDKTVRDMERIKGYLSKMVIRAPVDGIVNIMPNFRAQGSWGSTPPAFKEGDNAWTGAAIAEIPDLSEMRIELKLEEVDRGKVKLGQEIRVRVDAIPDREFKAKLDWISPIASLQFRGFGASSEKTFPARATLTQVDDRLRPGMSASAEVLIETAANSLLIPAKASFMEGGKPAVWVQRGQGFQVRLIEVGQRNDNDIVVTSGLQEGDRIALENPAEVAKRAKKF
ncbi:MAG: efflux RND transporter periplasmic adaptor subunit [Bryobacteraceae bacterium]|nr:efflux RND transporter periplasmic adaptor subunit [Solibacteraceae bacterium]MCL4844066.1 efflux RND transporter periplasmic adaptor subunit [Bryobacteraceae bacterium]MCO5351271.1 efflux RND transporter periplasmic adaptor subunit [Bryobacteraceae bacterium]